MEQPTIHGSEKDKYFTVEQILSLKQENRDRRLDLGKTPEARKEIALELLNKLLAEKERFKYVFKTEHGSIYFVLNTGESLRIKKQEPNNWQDEYEVQPLVRKIFFVDPQEWERISPMLKGRAYWKKMVGEPASEEEQKAFDKRKEIFMKLYDPIDEDDNVDMKFSHADSQRRGLAALIGEPIRISKIAVGSIPIEFDLVGRNDETLYEEEGDTLTLLGHKLTFVQDNQTQEKFYPESISISHYGHPISEIL